MIGKYLLTFRITVNTVKEFILPLKRDMVVTVLHRPLLHCSQETSSLNYLNTLFVLTNLLCWLSEYFGLPFETSLSGLF